MSLLASYRFKFEQIRNGLMLMTAFSLPISTTCTDMLFLLVTLFSVGSLKNYQELKNLYQHPVALIFVLFFILSLCNVIHTIAPLHEILKRLGKTSCFLMAGILMVTPSSEQWNRYSINAFLIAMLLVLFLSYLNSFLFPEFFHTRFDAPSDIFKDHIIQNYLMALATFILIYRCFEPSPRRYLYGILIVFCIYNMFFVSYGRSGHVIFLTGFLYLCFARFRWRGLACAFVTAAVLFLLAFSFSPGFKSRVISVRMDIQEYAQGNRITPIGERIESTKNAIQLYQQHPIFGSGTGSFSTAYAELQQSTRSKTNFPLSYNDYLNIAVEYGSIGLLLLLILFYIEWQSAKYLTHEWRFLIQILMISTVIGCLANPWLNDTTELHLFALFSALGFSQLKVSKTSNTCAGLKSHIHFK